jgi:hypothetical protein
MTLSISISEQAQANLKAKADLAGTDLSSYISSLVEQNAKNPLSLVEISGPIAEDFEKTGMTEDELGDLLETAKHAMRAERRARQAS